MNYSPRNCHPINLQESLTIPVSRQILYGIFMHILVILHKLLAIRYVIITFALVVRGFNKAQGDSIYSGKYC